ncbi:hypothetical protein Q6348_08395 [Isoptericola sp. b441]|uniref:Uncharacterized protein n=1 Tax=Actinotalea lenta TaxID=3064654 RepID=A0ABT9DAP2_9CELL|nr:hypothetical protein [Isoptericola sp. b441]MDO8107213.1 hypothetical protein [Isoptericola sp. b441]
MAQPATDEARTPGVWEDAAALAWAELERLNVADPKALTGERLAALDHMDVSGPGRRLMANRAQAVLTREPGGPLIGYLTDDDFDRAAHEPGVNPADLAARFHLRPEAARAAVADPSDVAYPHSVSVFRDGRVVAAVYSFDPDEPVDTDALDSARALTGRVNTLVLCPFTAAPAIDAPVLVGWDVWPAIFGVQFGERAHAGLRASLVRVCANQVLGQVLPRDEYVYDAQQRGYRRR